MGAGDKCSNCGKGGHVVKNCWSKGGGSERSREKTCMSQEASGYRGRVDVNDDRRKHFAFASSHVSSSDTDVIIDSGCTSSMFNDKRFFETLRMEEHMSVNNADSSSTAIRGRGTAVVRTRDSFGEECVLTLLDSLYVPDYSHSLLSVKRMKNKEFVADFQDPCCIRCPDGTNIPFLEKGNLFVLPIWFSDKEVGLHATAAGEASVETWHNRLGHNNQEDTAKLMSSLGIAQGKAEAQTVCGVCATQKARRVPVSRTTMRKTTYRFELVVMDVFGPIEKSFGEHRYAITFIDVHTRYAYIYFMRSKSDALDTTKQFIVDVKKPIELLSEVDATTLRSDNGGEYTSKLYFFLF